MILLKHHSDNITSVIKTLDSQIKAYLFLVTYSSSNLLAHLYLTICLTSSPMTNHPIHFQPHWNLCTSFSNCLEGSFSGYDLHIFMENSPSKWDYPWPCWPKFQSPTWGYIPPPAFLNSLALFSTYMFNYIWWVYCPIYSPKYKPQQVRISICLINTVCTRDVGKCFL